MELTLIALPSVKSATSNCSCKSGSTRRLSNFFNGLEIFPSTAAVAAASACVVSSNFSKWVNFNLKRWAKIKYSDEKSSFLHFSSFFW